MEVRQDHKSTWNKQILSDHSMIQTLDKKPGHCYFTNWSLWSDGVELWVIKVTIRCARSYLMSRQGPMTMSNKKLSHATLVHVLHALEIIDDLITRQIITFLSMPYLTASHLFLELHNSPISGFHCLIPWLFHRLALNCKCTLFLPRY